MRDFIDFSIKSMLAGMLIGLGDIIYVISENHILGSFLFSLGLLSILIKQYPLYTGRIGYITSCKDIWDTYGMIPMLIFNFLGIGLTCWVITYSHLNIDAVNTIVEVKFSQTNISAFTLSFGCGIMMYLAVNGWKKYENPIMVIMPIMFFILCGLDHCIANFGYLIMWVSHANINLLVLPNCYYLNLILMIIGNAVGSLVFSKN